MIAGLLLIATPALASPHRVKALPLATIEGYASQVAGMPVAIVCDADPSAEGGHAQFPSTIHLDPQVCAGLERPSDPSNNVAYAMLALSHEIEHIDRWPDPSALDEGVVECAAVQNRWQVVRRFKLPGKLATQLMADEMLIHLSIMPPAYRTAC